MALKYDLLLKGGEVIDPGQGIRGIRDVAFQGGTVAAVELDISNAEAHQVIDATGKLVTPGLIDIHGHYYHPFFSSGIVADEACLPFGVTTSMDAGSTGALHFDGFNQYILSKQETRLFALVNLSMLGMNGIDGDWGPTVGISGGPQTILPPNRLGELQDLRYANVERAIEKIKENPNLVLGVKVRVDVGVTGEINAVPCLERARNVADSTGTFVMVHVARSPIPMSTIVENLRPGDIVTHAFHYAEHNILDDKGRLRPEVVDAKAKGIVMDTGAVKNNFGVEISREAIEQGFLPDTLSTDRVRSLPVNPVVYSVPDVMTIYMGLGMTLEQVVAAATSNGARALGQEDTLGTLRPGAAGDAAVIDLEEGEFAYEDGTGTAVKCSTRISPQITVKDGERWRPPVS